MIPSLATLLISRRRRGLGYFTMHAAKQGVAIAHIMQSAE